MNWLKSLWTTLVRKTSTVTEEVSEEVVEVLVEEEDSPVAEIFEGICKQAGLGGKFLEGLNATEKFVQWYGGDADEESIRASFAEFKLTDPAINAKMTSIGGF
tara:strand:- start:8638 stop:8946 length:309 start_codon:yes stop_codon:yes gene_type:complete